MGPQLITKSKMCAPDFLIEIGCAICPDLFRHLFKLWDIIFHMWTSYVEVFELLINPPSFPSVEIFLKFFEKLSIITTPLRLFYLIHQGTSRTPFHFLLDLVNLFIEHFSDSFFSRIISNSSSTVTLSFLV